MSKVLISAKNVWKIFKSHTNETTVLENISVDIFAGDFTIIMGPSGAGKSTLLYALSGIDTITKGSVFYKEKEINKLTEGQMSVLRCSDFGFAFQESNLISHLTLFENVAVPGYLNKNISGREVRRRAYELLNSMNIGAAKDRFPFECSGGEVQRTAIARAMINYPTFIFADEPTGALNRKNSQEALDLFSSLNKKGQSILMVTHDLETAVRGTRILYLNDGRIIDEMRLPGFEKKEARDRENKIREWLLDLEW